MERALRSLGLKRLKQNFQVNLDLAEALDTLAKEEKRAPEELAKDLLAEGIARREQGENTNKQWERLTEREKEVVALVCLGYTNQEIGQKLYISPETVKTHVSNALRKFGVKRRGDIQRILWEWDFENWER